MFIFNHNKIFWKNYKKSYQKLQLFKNKYCISLVTKKNQKSYNFQAQNSLVISKFLWTKYTILKINISGSNDNFTNFTKDKIIDAKL